MRLAMRVATERFARELRARFGERLREIVLFGSHARGEADEESDVDLLVVVDGLTEAERRDVFDLAYTIDSTSPEWIGLSPLPYSTAQASELRARERRLLREADEEGIRL